MGITSVIATHAPNRAIVALLSTHVTQATATQLPIGMLMAVQCIQPKTMDKVAIPA